jgi:hypothetical protein
MKRLALTLTLIAAPAFAQPEANEGYCVGIAPENCPYAWAQNEGRWTYKGVPQTEIGIRHEGREDGPRLAKRRTRPPKKRPTPAPKPAH